MDPPLSDTLYQMEADSIYLVHFYCFPGKGTDGKSILDVDCLGVTGQTVYSGRSAPFEARPVIIITSPVRLLILQSLNE